MQYTLDCSTLRRKINDNSCFSSWALEPSAVCLFLHALKIATWRQFWVRQQQYKSTGNGYVFPQCIYGLMKGLSETIRNNGQKTVALIHIILALADFLLQITETACSLALALHHRYVSCFPVQELPSLSLSRGRKQLAVSSKGRQVLSLKDC